MRIGVDARFFGPAGKGLGRYTEKLIKNLERVDFENQYVVFLRQENWDEYTPAASNFKKVKADLPWYTFSEQIFLPRILAREKLDLMHFPHFNVPMIYRRKFIVTIHDLILLKYPTKRATTLGPMLYKIKYWGYKKTINRAIARASKIITVSNYTKSELVDYFKIDPQKVEVVYEAADSVESGQLSFPDDLFLKRHKITKPFLLYVGNAYPHKNLERLLLVFQKLKSKNFPYQLVLVGKEDYFYHRLKAQALRLGLLEKDEVVFFGFATQRELAALYQKASLYIFPSYVEGFGLPPLEAMNYGLPVLASSAASLPEILGKAALYFDPKNENETQRVILKATSDEQLRRSLIRLGYSQVKKYSWQKTAQKTKEIYEMAD